MSSESKGNLSSQSEGSFRGTTESPTQPGTYWFQSETTPRPLMVEVRVTNGQLTAQWLNQDEPVAKIKGRWRRCLRRRLTRWVTKGSRSQKIDWYQSGQAHRNYKWPMTSHDHSDGLEPTRRTFDRRAKVPQSYVRYP